MLGSVSISGLPSAAIIKAGYWNPVVVNAGSLEHDPERTDCACRGEDPEEETVQNKRDILPIFFYLEGRVSQKDKS